MRPLSPVLILAGLVLAAAAPAAAQQETPAFNPARSALSMSPPTPEEDAALLAAIESPSRPAEAKARDVFRHPYESLTFWGLRPGLTVVEIAPGQGGWWRAILEPYAGATGGRYVPVNDPATGLAEDGTADLILTARSIHGWVNAGRVDANFQAFFKALKPGGYLAVEQHRAVEGLNAAETARQGYVPESYVIQAAQRAGFVLDARSELNANAADDRDHPFGVWTLKPTRQSRNDSGSELTPEERAAFDAVGESDRMTLRFVKPE